MNSYNQGGVRAGNRPSPMMQPLIDQLDQVARQVGYDEMVERLFDGRIEGIHPEEPGAGVWHPGPGPSINVVPGEGAGPTYCTDHCLAVIRGTRGRFAHKTVMEAIARHLQACPMTKEVVLVTDTWRTDEFARIYAPAWRIAAAHGTQFAVVIGGEFFVGLQALEFLL